ncbi:MAG TPA: hypothetical protein VI027_03065 [Rubrobacteraceae bacterium]
MRWYNPTSRVEEEVPAPISEAQAIEMLSGHQDSEQFIEVYWRLRSRHPEIVQALIFTGETFYMEHRRGQPPN